MTILLTFGVMLAMAFGLGAAAAIRDRRSRLGRPDQRRIDEDKSHSLIIPTGGHYLSEYLPPPDDGRPR